MAASPSLPPCPGADPNATVVVTADVFFAVPGLTLNDAASPALLTSLCDSLASYLQLPSGSVASAGAPVGVLHPRRGVLVTVHVTLTSAGWGVLASSDPAAGLPPQREAQVEGVVAALRDGMPLTPTAEFGPFLASPAVRGLNLTMTVDQVRV